MAGLMNGLIEEGGGGTVREKYLDSQFKNRNHILQVKIISPKRGSNLLPSNKFAWSERTGSNPLSCWILLEITKVTEVRTLIYPIHSPMII